MFESVVVVAFQSAFHSGMHQNNIYIFYFLKLFFISEHQNDIKH